MFKTSYNKNTTATTIKGRKIDHKQKVYIFQKREQEVWSLKHFPLDQGGMEQGDARRGKLEDLSDCKGWSSPVCEWCSPRHLSERSQSSTSLSAAVNRKNSTMSQKFLALNFAPPGPKMNETFSKQTSRESTWNFETKFLPVLRNLEVVGHEFYYIALLGSVWTGNPEAGGGGGREGGTDLNPRTRTGWAPHVALISNSC